MTLPVEQQQPAPTTRTFRQRLDRAGSVRYHHRHPFNLLMHAGLLEREDLELWVANRYYYQQRIPIKDALILSKAEDPAFRRVWLQRLIDHDGGSETQAGGLELWLRLAEALGLQRTSLETHQQLLPEVRRACDDYVELVRASDLLSAVAASLTERYAAGLMRARIHAWNIHYPWIDAGGLAYFERRVTQAHADANFALEFVERHARSERQQQVCLAAFETKCRILWQLLDAVYLARRWGLLPRLTPHASLSPAQAGVPDSAALLLAPERGFELNTTARELLKRCDGATSLEAIGTELAQQHGISIEQFKLDVASFLAELELRRLLSFERPGA